MRRPEGNPRLRRLIRLAAAAGAAFLVIVTAEPASAEPHPTPPTATPSAEPSPTLPPDPFGEDAPPTGGLMDRIVGTDSTGSTPLDHYDIGYDEGGTFSVARKVEGFLIDALFGAARWLVRLSLALITWALRCTLAGALAEPASKVASAYQTRVVGRLGLAPFFLFLAASWSGWQILRGRTTRGVGEFGISLVVGAVTATMLAQPATVLLGDNGLLRQTRDISLEVASVTTATDPDTAPPPGADYDAVVSPMVASFRHSFVEEPHQLLNWGQVLDDPERPHRCAAVYRELIRTGPHGTSDKPRHAMRDAGCGDLADFNHDPSVDRLLAALLMLVATIIAVVLMIVVAGGVVAAQLTLVALVCVAPFAFAAGVLPGAGRQLLWRWVTAVARALAAVLMTAAFLSLFLTLLSALLTATRTQSLTVRMGLVDALVIGAFVARRRLAQAGSRTVTDAGRRLEGARVGGTHGHGPLRPALGGVAGGLAAGALWREVRGEMPGVVARAGLYRASRFGYHRGRSARAAATGDTPDGASPLARVSGRLAQSRTGRTALTATRLGAGLAKVALQGTIGAPVYLPRAANAARAASAARTAATRARLDAARGRVRAFGAEYTGNLATASRGVTLVTRPLAAAAMTTAALAVAPPTSRPPVRRPVATATAPPPHRATPPDVDALQRRLGGRQSRR